MFQTICLLPRELTIAVSGGIDSTAVAHFLGVKCRNKYQVTVFHFNHKLRPQNDEMEKKVRAFCERFSLPIVVKSREVDVKPTESNLRRLRIQHYLDHRLNVVSGHHLQDAVESSFLNFLTGVHRKLPIPIKTDFGNGTTIYHPFLTTDKAKFASYITRNDLSQFIEEDETNVDSEVGRRNKARQVILPMLKQEFKVGLDKIIRKRYLEAISKTKTDLSFS